MADLFDFNPRKLWFLNVSAENKVLEEIFYHDDSTRLHCGTKRERGRGFIQSRRSEMIYQKCRKRFRSFYLIVFCPLFRHVCLLFLLFVYKYILLPQYRNTLSQLNLIPVSSERDYSQVVVCYMKLNYDNFFNLLMELLRDNLR